MSFLSVFKKNDVNEQKAELTEDVHNAWLRWQTAVEYFNSVTDPELTECAIHNIEATRIHYMYLLNKARKEDVSSMTDGGIIPSISTVRQINGNKSERVNWG